MTLSLVFRVEAERLGLHARGREEIQTGNRARGAQQRHQWYNRPTQTGSVVRHIGEGYHLNWLRSETLRMVEIDADH